MGVTFDDFWAAYPRRVGKLAAMKAWQRAILIDSAENIIAGIAPYKANKPEYADWCHPSTWLNQGRWLDEYEDETPLQSKRYEDWTDKDKRFVADYIERFRGKIENPLRNLGFGSRNDIEQRLKAEGYMEQIRLVSNE